MEKKVKTNEKETKLIEVSFLILLTIIVSVLLTYSISFSLFNKKQSENQKFLSQIEEQYNFIKKNYYQEYKEEDLVKGAVSGMLGALNDPFSSVINDSTYDRELAGEYDGLGVQIGLEAETNKIIVTAVFDDSPASKAGIKPGDYITKVDDYDLKGKSTTKFVEYISNSKKNDFTLYITREEQEIKTEIKKGKITLKSVTSEIKEANNKKIGYMYISTFALNTDEQFSTELNKLEDEKIDSLIIDLRDNGGGHLQTVTYMLYSLIGKNKIIYQTEKDKKISKIYSNGKTDYQKPIIVLVNKKSASASEILVSCLQEQLNATIVGTTTYGKGTVQEVSTTTGGFKYKLSTKKWLTSNGVWINEKGIKPDYEIELDEQYFETYDKNDDNQLAKAIELLTK